MPEDSGIKLPKRIIEFSFREQSVGTPRDTKTQSEVWLEKEPTTIVEMNGVAGISRNGEVLFTEGFNGCTSLLVRVAVPEGIPQGLLTHHDTGRKGNDSDLAAVRSLATHDSKMYGTVLYPLDKHGQSLGQEVEQVTDELVQRLSTEYEGQWEGLRKQGYAVFEGFPGKVNSNRLVYNVKAGVWLYREQRSDTLGEEHPYSGLMYKIPEK